MPTAPTQRGASTAIVMMATLKVAQNAQVCRVWMYTSSNTHFCKKLHQLNYRVMSKFAIKGLVVSLIFSWCFLCS